MHYFRELGGALSQLLNAIAGGNKDQTFSARCYEAAVVKGYRRWLLPYWLVNAVFYALRWVIGRALGFRFGVDMPRNHCMDAYHFDNEHSYEG